MHKQFSFVIDITVLFFQHIYAAKGPESTRPMEMTRDQLSNIKSTNELLQTNINYLTINAFKQTVTYMCMCVCVCVKNLKKALGKYMGMYATNIKKSSHFRKVPLNHTTVLGPLLIHLI